MAKITRKTQLVFGGNLLAQDNIAKFGSAAIGYPEYSLDPDAIQTTEYLDGWEAAVVNNSAPMLQDMNALFHLFSKQMAYLMQTGIPEYDASTVYYTGSIVNNGAGNIYVSTAASHSAATTDPTKWAPVFTPGTVAKTGPGTNGTPIVLDCQVGQTFNVAAGAGGNKYFDLHNLRDGMTAMIATAGSNTNTVTIRAFSDAGSTALAVKTAASTTMTSAESLFHVRHIGDGLNWAIVTPTHGLS